MLRKIAASRRLLLGLESSSARLSQQSRRRGGLGGGGGGAVRALGGTALRRQREQRDSGKIEGALLSAHERAPQEEVRESLDLSVSSYKEGTPVVCISYMSDVLVRVLLQIVLA